MKPIYVDSFLRPDQLDAIEAELLALPWETKRTARHEYFMADGHQTYSYGKDDGTIYQSKPWSFHADKLRWLLKLPEISQLAGCDLTGFNACFLNKYDDQHQHLGWHADDFAGMDPTAPIAVMSFGAEREIWVKESSTSCPMEWCVGGKVLFEGEPDRPCPYCNGRGRMFPKGPVPPEDRYLLKRGSLFVMPPGFQDVMLHRIPKHDRPCGWRISLTFRKFL